MEEDVVRIYYTIFGWGHISFGAVVITLGVAQANEDFWPFHAMVLGVCLIYAGIYYLQRVRGLRDPPPEAPAPLANGHARVGIPLAPAERNDPELAIEGLLLNHPPPEAPALHPNGRVGIALAPAERDDLEPAIEGFLLNHPPPEAPEPYPNFRVGIPLALAERDDPELAIEGLILDYELPLFRGALRNLVVVHNPPVAADVHGRVGIQLAPAKQDDPELAMVGHVHDPPQVLNWREWDGVEQAADNEARSTQMAEGNGTIRVGIHPGLSEQGDTKLSMLGHVLHDPPVALGRRERDGVEESVRNDIGQLKVTAESDAFQAEIRLKPTEVIDSSLYIEGLPLRQNDYPKLHDPALEIREEDFELVRNRVQEHALLMEEFGQLCDRGKSESLDGTEQIVLANEPVQLRLLDQVFQEVWKKPMQDALRDDKEQVSLLVQPMMKGPMQDRMIGDTVQSEALVEPLQAEALVKPLQDEAPVEPLQAEAPVEPLQAEAPVEPLQAEALVEPLQAACVEQDTPLSDVKKSTLMDKVGQAKSENDKRLMQNSKVLNAFLDKS